MMLRLHFLVCCMSLSAIAQSSNNDAPFQAKKEASQLLRRGARSLMEMEDYQQDYGVQGKIDNGDYLQDGGAVQGKAECEWVQLGSDIQDDSNVTESEFGRTISLDTSGNTTRVAIGAPLYGNLIEGAAFPFSDQRGLVRVFELVDSNWMQIGGDIVGTMAGVKLGSSLSLAGNGTILAVGAKDDMNPNAIVSGNRHGSVQVYELINGTDWLPRGRPLYGSRGNSNFGTSVSLSSDAQVLAVGAPSFSYVFEKAGQVQTFAFDGIDWEKRGSDFVGKQDYDELGGSVSLSDDGQSLAMSSSRSMLDLQALTEVFRFLPDLDDWSSVGKYTGGESSATLSGDGLVAASGDRLEESADGSENAGLLNVYELIEDDTYDTFDFEQLGDTLEGDEAHAGLGAAVSLSQTGAVMAVGAQLSVRANVTDYVQISMYDEDTWIPVGDRIEEEMASDSFGAAVSLAPDGTMVAVGAPSANAARVYQIDASCLEIPTVGLSPSAAAPTSDSTSETTSPSSSPQPSLETADQPSVSPQPSLETTDQPSFSPQPSLETTDQPSSEADSPTSSPQPSLETTNQPSVSPRPSLEITGQPSETASPTSSPQPSFESTDQPSEGELRPTLDTIDQPTSTEVNEPTQLPRFQAKGKDYCTKDDPCPLCHGDCDEDEDCEGDLICFQRDGGDEIPGCRDGEESTSRTDYCIYPEDLTEATSTTGAGDETSTTSGESTASTTTNESSTDSTEGETTSTVSDEASTTTTTGDETTSTVSDGTSTSATGGETSSTELDATSSSTTQSETMTTTTGDDTTTTVSNETSTTVI